MKKNILIFATLGIICFSCKNEITISPEEKYNKMSNEFAAKLLELSEFSCSCIIEPTYTLLDYRNTETPEDNLRRELMLWVNLKHNSELDSLNNLSRKVGLNETLMNYDYKIISKKQAESIVMIKNRKERQRIMDSLCPNSFMTMTKPFFNKSMDSVFIIVDDMPYSCFSSIISSFHYINGEWIIPIKL